MFEAIILLALIYLIYKLTANPDPEASEGCKLHTWVRDESRHLYCSKCNKRPGIE